MAHEVVFKFSTEGSARVMQGTSAVHVSQQVFE